MKKLFLLLFLVLFTRLSAQEVLFPCNESGIPFINGQVETSLSKDQVYEKIRNWIIATTTTSQSIHFDDKDKGIIAFRGTKQTKSTYNPFAGVYTESLSYLFKINYSSNVVTYDIDEFVLIKSYAGYGTNTQSIVLKDLVEQINTARLDMEKAKDKNNKEMSGKEKKNTIKKAEEIIEDNTESLKKANAEMQIIVDSFKVLLK